MKRPMPTLDLAALFPDEDYRFAMKFGRGSPEDFFAPTPQGPRVLAERRQWLEKSHRDYVALEPEGGQVLAETLELLNTWPETQACLPVPADPSPATCLERDVIAV